MTFENLCPQKVRESLCLAGHSTAVKDRPGTGLTYRIIVELGQVPQADSHVVSYIEVM